VIKAIIFNPVGIYKDFFFNEASQSSSSSGFKSVQRSGGFSFLVPFREAVGRKVTKINPFKIKKKTFKSVVNE
jgi:hypothetical protein